MALAPSPTGFRIAQNTTDPFSITQATLGVWARIDQANFLETFVLSEGADAFVDDYVHIRLVGGEVRYELEENGNFHSGDSSTGGLLPWGGWYYIVLQIDGSDFEVFASTEDGTLDMDSVLTFSHTLGFTTPGNLALYFRNQLESLVNFKAWTALLTPAELRLERDAFAITRTADIWGAIPLNEVADGLLDISANGHDLHEDLGGAFQETNNPVVLGGDPPDPPTLPDAPSNLTAAAEGYQAIRLNWDDNSDNEDDFQLERCVGAGCSDFAQIATPSADVETLLNSNLFANTTYRYRIRARNEVGDSDYSNIAEATTNPLAAVRFPGTPGTYYHAVPDATESLPSDAFAGGGGGVCWIRLESATGESTIMAMIENYVRAWTTSVVPSDINEWDFGNPIGSWIWFGVRNGVLTLEVQDGRASVRGETGSTVIYDSAEERAAAIAAFRADRSFLSGNDAATVPIFTQDVVGPLTTKYHATYPNGSDSVHAGDYRQFQRLSGPLLEVGQWYRVGWRWVTDDPDENGNFVSSTLELWVGCEKVAEKPWLNLQGTHGFLDLVIQGLSGRLLDHFVGGLPNSTHQDLSGLSPAPIALYDHKWFYPNFAASTAEGECDCSGSTPYLWWKLRDTEDLLDFGGGPEWDPLVIGTVADGTGDVVNPCNGGDDGEPPEPPSPELPPDDGEPPTVELHGGIQARQRLIRRLRQAPHLSNEDRRVQYGQFQLDLQAGIGTTSGQGLTPTVYLSWSDDGGHRWSNAYPVNLSGLGHYKQRALWRRLGQARKRMFRVEVSDPVDWVLLDAFLELIQGAS